MPTSVRKVEPAAYRRLKARAAAEGKTMGEALTEAIVAYTEQVPPPPPGRAARSRAKPSKASPPDDERLTREKGFSRPPPARGAFVNDPFVIVEVEDHA